MIKVFMILEILILNISIHEATPIDIHFYSLSDQCLTQKTFSGSQKGLNQFSLDLSDQSLHLNRSGVLFYAIETDFGTVKGKSVVLR